MKKWILLSVTLIMTTGALVGCSNTPGEATPATQAEIDNDPAINEPGGV